MKKWIIEKPDPGIVSALQRGSDLSWLCCQVLAAQGIENYTSARDAAKLLDALYSRTLVSPEASAQMLGILQDQRLNGKIPFYLHTLNPVPLIAHKTGEDYRITHDVSIIEGDHPMILCFMGSDVDVPALERLMADAAYALYQAG